MRRMLVNGGGRASEWGLQTSQQKRAVYSASSEIQLEQRRSEHSTCLAEIET